MRATETKHKEAENSKTLFDLLTTPRYIVSASALCVMSFISGLGVGTFEKWMEGKDPPLPEKSADEQKPPQPTSASTPIDGILSTESMLDDIKQVAVRPGSPTQLPTGADAILPRPLSPTRIGSGLEELTVPAIDITPPAPSAPPAEVAPVDPTLIPTLGVRHLSEHGLDLIKTFEDCKLTAYRCPGNRWTIGFGHTRTTEKGMKITREKAEALFLSDIQERVQEERRFFESIPMTDRQFDAIASSIFNAYCVDKGRSEFAETARDLIPRLNASVSHDERVGIARKIAVPLCKFNKVRGKVNDGLLRRRLSEALLIAHAREPIVTFHEFNHAKKLACQALGIRSPNKKNEAQFLEKLCEVVFLKKCSDPSSLSPIMLADTANQSAPLGTPSPSQRPPV